MTTRSKRLMVIAALACALGAGAALAELGGARTGVSPVIFPPQKITVRFSHAKHIKQGLSCDYCHEHINSSMAASDRNLPPEKTCTGDGCHAIDHKNPTVVRPGPEPTGTCSVCHPGYRAGTAVDAGEASVEKIGLPMPNIKFPHKLHHDKGFACKICHGDMKTQELGTRANLPRMTTCLGCHDGRTAPAQCTTCHLSLPDGRVRVTYPEGQLVPSGQIRGDDHDMTFATSHGRVAENDRRYCESCHKQAFCIDCHAGEKKPNFSTGATGTSNGLSIHGNDYLTIHPVDARKDNPSCAACHKMQTFCVSCHQRVGVGADPPGPFNTQRGQLRGLFHPAGWADTTTRGPNHHSWQAQRNLRSCASCHRENFCTSCHATVQRGATGGFSPHPHGWSGSGFCKALAARNERMCIKCHDPYDSNGVADQRTAAFLNCQRP